MEGYDTHSIFICCNSSCLGPKGRQAGIYVSGMLFALGWWMFIDTLSFSFTLSDRKVLFGVEDWVPGIITTLGMIVVCLIDKSSLRDSWGESGSWQARLCLFLGFAMMAGGLAGAVSVLVVKYIMHDLDSADCYPGIGIVVQCGLLMLSTAILWISQTEEPSFRI
ncbi:predicted protein [Lichtheimia corymbifera JMRC:FSU:9682]|uniref:Uncharacterized protein n=1 Tax=Lichtheimia corymbifera JMRC:FSU:9682 TaxID=1263082 RepID=A0A068RGW6_9FUNG|nr:predicted protein [Lichtheimia corymbifera JMRC:FSU:9682]